MIELKPDPSWSLAFFEGYTGLTDFEERFRKACDAIGCRTELYDELYAQPGKIRDAREHDTWCLVTTGMNREGLAGILAVFERMDYLPRRVVFPLGEDEFLGYVNHKGLRGKIEFYRVLNERDGTLIRLTYLDD